MDAHVLRASVDFINSIVPRNAVLNLNLTGGEPFLRQDIIISLVRRIWNMCVSKSCLLRAYVNTSAYLPAKLSTLLTLNSLNVSGMRSWVEISLNGPEHINDYHRVLPGGFGTYRASYGHAKQMLNYVPVFIRTVLPPVAAEHLDDYLIWFERRFREGFWLAEVGTAIGYFSYSDDFAKFYSELVDELLKLIADLYLNGQFILWRTVAENALFSQSIERTTEPVEYLPCAAGKRRFLIDVDGMVYYCTMFREFAPESGKIGSVFDGVTLSPLRAPCPLSVCKSGSGAITNMRKDYLLLKKILGKDLFRAYLNDAKRWV